MSTEAFNNALIDEISRIDYLFNLEAKSKIYDDRVDGNPFLQAPGLSLVAARMSAPRRTFFCQLLLAKIKSWASEKIKDTKACVIANHNSGHFIRELTAQTCGLNFRTLDSGELQDDDWLKLTPGVNLLSQAAERIHWEDGGVSLPKAIEIIESLPPFSTMLIENFHLMAEVASPAEAIKDLRNTAVNSRAFVYVGCGLNHWQEVKRNSIVQLSDLAEGLTGAVNVVDIISILTPEEFAIKATIFDAKNTNPRAATLGPLST